MLNAFASLKCSKNASIMYKSLAPFPSRARLLFALRAWHRLTKIVLDYVLKIRTVVD